MTIMEAGFDIANRVRARDVQMAAVADIQNRTLMLTGAIDTNAHDINVAFELPTPGRWQVVKAETNLTGNSWLAWEMTTDDDTVFLDQERCTLASRQFQETFMRPDGKRVVFYNGQVRPGEAILKMFSIEASTRVAYLSHIRFPEEEPGSSMRSDVQEAVRKAVVDGMPRKKTVELTVPVVALH